jgi:hypothetical protein
LFAPKAAAARTMIARAENGVSLMLLNIFVTLQVLISS